MADDIDADDLPPLQNAVMELLAARHRLGETVWTVHSKLLPPLRVLESLGLVGWKYGVVEESALAWLTDAGKAATMSATYQSPIAVERDALQARIDDYENAICWGVDCVHQAKQLDQAISDYERGLHAGLLHAAAAIEEERRRITRDDVTFTKHTGLRDTDDISWALARARDIAHFPSADCKRCAT